MLVKVVEVERCSEMQMFLDRVSHCGAWEGAWRGELSPSYDFFEPLLPSKPMAPMGHTPHLKMKPLPIWKTTTPLLKRRAPFHEMIPRKGTKIIT